jgi:hypothetical protein
MGWAAVRHHPIHINDLAVLVNRPIQVARAPANLKQDLRNYQSPGPGTLWVKGRATQTKLANAGAGCGGEGRLCTQRIPGSPRLEPPGMPTVYVLSR